MQRYSYAFFVVVDVFSVLFVSVCGRVSLETCESEMERKERGIPAACMSSRERRSSLEMGSMGCEVSRVRPPDS